MRRLCGSCRFDSSVFDLLQRCPNLEHLVIVRPDFIDEDLIARDSAFSELLAAIKCKPRITIILGSVAKTINDPHFRLTARREAQLDHLARHPLLREFPFHRLTVPLQVSTSRIEYAFDTFLHSHLRDGSLWSYCEHYGFRCGQLTGLEMVPY
ncbi:hypothetical protein PYCC9005_005121 [Savitreella phatthalungensis]